MKPTLYEGQTSVGESTTSFYPSVSRFEKAGLLQTFGIFKTLVLGRKAKSSWPNRSFQTTQGAYWCTLYITFFQLATDCNTRGHSLKISKHYCKTDMRKFFISYKVIIRWHSLPEEAIQVDSINSFKKHLQKICSTRMGFFLDCTCDSPQGRLLEPDFRIQMRPHLVSYHSEEIDWYERSFIR